MTCDAIGGVWRYAVDLSAALAERGIETVLVGTGPRPSRSAVAELAWPPVWLDLPPSWLAADPSVVARLAEELGRLQRLHSADLVHVNQPSEAAFLDVDVPVVAAAHSCLTTWWRAVRGDRPPADWAWRAGLEADGIRRVAAVVAPTASHAAAVAQAYGIDTPFVVSNASNAPAGRPQREPLVGAAGRWWDEGKNLAVLDAAAAHCRWPVLLFGSLSGPDGSSVTVRHARAQGQRPSDELLAAMRSAAIFVSPSLYEPFGLAALEAARSGAALVLADIPTYRELWQGAALFFDPRSPVALVEALDRLATDAARRTRWSAAAAARASEFTPERQIDALLEAYAAAGVTGAVLEQVG
jgi:glycosyltransferase involved in cell wall biosynthesis